MKLYKDNIPKHRGIRNISSARQRASHVFLIPTFFTIAAWPLLIISGKIWKVVIEFCFMKLNIPGEVIFIGFGPGWFHIHLPQIHLQLDIVSFDHWLTAMLLSLLLFCVSFIFSNRFLPIRYYFRLISFIQAVALAVLLLFPALVPLNIGKHLEGIIVVVCVVMIIIPIIFALTYYIFDFSFQQKVLLTLLTLLFFIVFTPFFVVFHTIILFKVSIVLMPVMFFVFGVSIPIMHMIAFYGWGMSWRISDRHL